MRMNATFGNYNPRDYTFQSNTIHRLGEALGSAIANAPEEKRKRIAWQREDEAHQAIQEQKGQLEGLFMPMAQEILDMTSPNAGPAYSPTDGGDEGSPGWRERRRLRKSTPEMGERERTLSQFRALPGEGVDAYISRVDGLMDSLAAGMSENQRQELVGRLGELARRHGMERTGESANRFTMVDRHQKSMFGEMDGQAGTPPQQVPQQTPLSVINTQGGDINEALFDPNSYIHPQAESPLAAARGVQFNDISPPQQTPPQGGSTIVGRGEMPLDRSQEAGMPLDRELLDARQRLVKETLRDLRNEHMQVMRDLEAGLINSREALAREQDIDKSRRDALRGLQRGEIERIERQIAQEREDDVRWGDRIYNSFSQNFDIYDPDGKKMQQIGQASHRGATIGGNRNEDFRNQQAAIQNASKRAGGSGVRRDSTDRMYEYERLLEMPVKQINEAIARGEEPSASAVDSAFAITIRMTADALGVPHPDAQRIATRLRGTGAFVFLPNDNRLVIGDNPMRFNIRNPVMAEAVVRLAEEENNDVNAILDRLRNYYALPAGASIPTAQENHDFEKMISRSYHDDSWRR